MSVFLDTKKASYQSQRAVSQGAGITLVSAAGEYVASFDCATRVAQVLGNRELRDQGDGIYEAIPVYRIPLTEMHSALQKLSARFSVALVELTCSHKASQFVLVWKIAANPSTMQMMDELTRPTKAVEEFQELVKTPSPTNLDEY